MLIDEELTVTEISNRSKSDPNTITRKYDAPNYYTRYITIL
jgi:hypothetical protein